VTKRELDVIGLVVTGLSNQEIADRLGLSARTVQAHLASAMAKTGARTRTQLAVCALRRGWVPLDQKEPADGSAFRTIDGQGFGRYSRDAGQVLGSEHVCAYGTRCTGVWCSGL